MVWVGGILIDLLTLFHLLILQVEMYKESQGACQKVLEKEPNNVKALFRYGKVCTQVTIAIFVV